jgi:hypothetical protein
MTENDTAANETMVAATVAMASAALTAYHLGAIRQILAGLELHRG